jgi:hypothetical protein
MIPTQRVFELLDNGLFSNCLAIIDGIPEIDNCCNKLLSTAKLYYKRIAVLNLPASHIEEIQRKSKSADLVLVKGLNKIDAHSNQAYAIRTFLDINRHNDLAAIIFFDPESYSRHFNDETAPFYQFCHTINADSIL